MKTFYFTGTGNSLYVAKKIGGEIHSIPKLLKEGKRKFQANYYFAVMTYGNMAASGLNHIEQLGAKAGIKFNYTN